MVNSFISRIIYQQKVLPKGRVLIFLVPLFLGLYNYLITSDFSKRMSIYSTNIFHFSPRTIFLLIHFFLLLLLLQKKKFFFLLLFETRSVHVSIVFPFYYAFFTFPFPYHTCACLYKHFQTLRKFSILILSREARTEGNRAFIDFFLLFQNHRKNIYK